jgi:hypothetical protein
MRRSFGKILIGIVVFGLCLGAAFGAGTVYGRHSTTKSANAAAAGSSALTGAAGTTRTGAAASSQTGTTSTAVSQGGTTQASGPQGGTGFAFGGGFGSRPIQGIVASISAQQMQVTLAAGATASSTVALDAQTIYATAQTADRSALKTGANIDVTTITASDGTISAQSVIVVPVVPAPTGGQTTQASGPSGTGGFGRTGGRTTGASGASGPSGAAGTGGRGFGGGGAANRSVDGTVASVDGDQLKVTLANGSDSSVTLTNQTTYQTTQTAAQSAVTSGASVLVTISRGTDGTLTATSVVVLPATT